MQFSYSKTDDLSHELYGIHVFAFEGALESESLKTDCGNLLTRLRETLIRCCEAGDPKVAGSRNALFDFRAATRFDSWAETIVHDAVTTLSGFGWRVAILASPLNRPQLRSLELRLRSPLLGVGPVAYDLFEVPRVAACWLYGRPSEQQETPSAFENTNVLLDYTNHRGERGVRPVTPVRIWFGATTWHPVPGWLLEAFDLDKRGMRDFAMASVHSMLPFAR
jgi:hypothetical protein